MPPARWSPFITNKGDRPSAILSDIRIFDGILNIPNASLTNSNGDTLCEDGYEEWRDALDKPFRLAPTDGVPCKSAFPYFRL